MLGQLASQLGVAVVASLVIFGFPAVVWAYLKLTRRLGKTTDGRPKLWWTIGAVAVMGAYACAGPYLLQTGFRVIGQ